MKIELKDWALTFYPKKHGPVELSFGLSFTVDGKLRWPRIWYYEDLYDGFHHSIWFGWFYVYWLT